MNDTTFAPGTLAEYMEWQAQDRKTLRKINELIKDIHRNGYLYVLGNQRPSKAKKDTAAELTRPTAWSMKGMTIITSGFFPARGTMMTNAHPAALGSFTHHRCGPLTLLFVGSIIR
jgi:Txe/YoeB family toxin of Txe-Axe toxin-antitoxin module